ncbi:MAG: bifunctional 4-hydroxy-2-oxoglutarate aldolase/2-dehydro-3-deoxy-phosphogluconate aldolase [Verrucomicrobiota bacterium]
MNKQKVIDGLVNPGVVAILRADSSKELIDASGALIQGGVHAVEVTLTTPNALQVIRDLKKEFGDRILLGVGSVLTEEQAAAAVEAGACYVITPVVRPKVIEFCVRQSVVICSGSYSPTEALQSSELGADFVKIFPADGLGANYIKAILAPMPHLAIIPTGGVDEKTCGAFIAAGCRAVAAGSSLVSKEILKSQDWAKLTSQATKMVEAVREARAKLKAS